MRDIKELFEILKIKPNNIQLYEQALTHRSFNADANTKHHDNERLEYMGDAVLDYVSADLIFHEYQEMEPGSMTKLRSNLVNTTSLSKYARELQLNDFIKSGHSISKQQINQSNNILEDCMEAVIGAIYLDQGMDVAFNFIKNLLIEDLHKMSQVDLTDYKSKLQEEMQTEYRESVHYVVVNESGPAHDKTFEVNVLFNDIVLASGTGKSKKAAQQDAAKKALMKRKI